VFAEKGRALCGVEWLDN